jgi:dethiobiotin synthetase
MPKDKPLFVTGISTDVGKTIISAIIVEKLKADYWKPVQSGDLQHTDTMKVQALVSNRTTTFHPETYRLTQPLSPHQSADIDGVKINLETFKMPNTSNRLIIEGAGGLMVPLNDSELVIDLIRLLDAEVVLVAKNYLGSINHTLLSVSLLKQYQIPVMGIIFNGNSNPASEEYILNYTGITLLGSVPEFTIIDKEAILSSHKLINL